MALRSAKESSRTPHWYRLDGPGSYWCGHDRYRWCCCVPARLAQLGTRIGVHLTWPATVPPAGSWFHACRNPSCNHVDDFFAASGYVLRNRRGYYHAFAKRDLSGNDGVLLGRLAVAAVAILAALLAWPRSDTILGLVAFAWAGFGASFGPTVILSLYWRKFTYQGAIAGMIAGAVTVGVWGNLSGGLWDLYEILPGFLLNLLFAVVVSKMTYKPNEEIEKELTKP